VTLLALKGTEQRLVAILLEMEQKGLDDTRNLLELVHKLFLSYCAPFLSRVSYQPRLSSWTMPLANLLTLLDVNVFLNTIKHHFFNQWTGG
jgi:hypothetical protein